MHFHLLNLNIYLASGPVQLVSFRYQIRHLRYSKRFLRFLDFAEGAFGHLDPDTYAAVLDKHAKSEAERLLPSYQKMYDESLDVPDLETSLSQFDKRKECWSSCFKERVFS